MKIVLSPIFILCTVLFFVHQLMQKVLDIHFDLVDRYMDNFLAMPIILSLLVIERSYLLGRKHRYRLSGLEIVVATFVIVMVAELLFPLLSRNFVTDWWDVLFYALGSLFFYLTINKKE